jgi:hypothetical protein
LRRCSVSHCRVANPHQWALPHAIHDANSESDAHANVDAASQSDAHANVDTAPILDGDPYANSHSTEYRDGDEVGHATSKRVPHSIDNTNLVGDHAATIERRNVVPIGVQHPGTDRYANDSGPNGDGSGAHENGDPAGISVLDPGASAHHNGNALRGDYLHAGRARSGCHRFAHGRSRGADGGDEPHPDPDPISHSV